MSIKLIEIRKSNNVNAKVSSNGFNLTEDGREYYIAVFQDANNPFAPKKVRVISQQFNSEGIAVWASADPNTIKQYVGKELSGQFVTSKVEPYYLDDKMVDSYTTVVLGHENTETVFKNAKHPIISTNTVKYNNIENKVEITEAF